MYSARAAMIGIIGLLLFLLPDSISGQDQDLTTNYTPSLFRDTISAPLLADLESRREVVLNKIKDSDRRAYAIAKNIYKKSFRGVVNIFNSDRVTTNHELTNYLIQTLDIIQRDSHPKDSMLVFVYGDPSPNAFSSAEGVLACNTGLITRMENKEQLAFVLAHELAHYRLNHMPDQVVALARLDYDESLAQDIKSIRTSSYQNYTRMKELIASLRLSTTRHSRDHEFQADSLGFALYRRAGLNPAEVFRTLEILDSADLSKHTETVDLQKYFSFTSYPLKKEWLDYSNGKMFRKPILRNESDTAKTHPDCKRRIMALKAQIGNIEIRRSTPGVDNAQYFSHLSEFEQVESLFHLKKYGKCLFETLILLERYPDNLYLHSMVGRNLYFINQSQINHTFGRAVEQPDDRLNENYNRLLTFIQKLRAVEIATIANQYMVSKDEKYFDDEHFLYSFWLVSCLPGSTIDPELVKDDYKKKFPNSRLNNFKK